MTGKFLPVFCAALLTHTLHAQEKETAHKRHQTVVTDSLASDFHSIVAHNFSRYRTVNFNWETKAAHNYTLRTDRENLEKGRKRDLHTLRLSTMIPMLKKKSFSLYANMQYAGYTFDCADKSPAIFSKHSYNQYSGGFSTSYIATLFNRPLILSADVLADGWDGGWGIVQARFVAAMTFSKNRHTGFTLGVAGMTVGTVPIIPIFSFWHRFRNPDWSIDITPVSHMYLRYQHGSQRASIGCSMSVDNFYLRPKLADTPSVCCYSEVALKPEILYEYIINRHFYLTARAGLSATIKNGLYTKYRRELDTEVKQKRSAVPFFNVGISYSLFK